MTRVLDILRQPVGVEARELLARNWTSLAERMRTAQQMFGRQGNGCGATIGVMPRCDFACRGCYLNADANHVPAETLEGVKEQMRRLRPILGNAGNLQLTDGEVTLRPVSEVVELLRYAQSLGLIPMLMTHGDSFRRRPGLLEQLMLEGGLTEVSIHVDTTQRGRHGAQWRSATTEAELNPLRAQFAEMILAACAATGRPLRAATTMTVTRENIAGVADVVRWLATNADAFRMISFQPIAQVGRTEEGYGGGVDVESLWNQIALGLGIVGGASRMAELGVWFGHEACNRMVNGVVASTRDGDARFHALRDSADALDTRIVDGFLERFGGISFRLDSAGERLARMLALALREPRFLLGNLVPFARHWLERVGEGRALSGLARLVAQDITLTPLVLVSHHFMSHEEIETPLGQERLAHCVFHVPVQGELLSMCEVNALGRRDAFYEQLAPRPA